MAWTATDNFNSYSNGDLAGENGGSGWSGAWSNGATALINVVDSPVYEGAKSIELNTTDNTFYTRDLTTAISTNGNILYMVLRRTSTSSGEIANSIRNSSTGNRVGIKMNASGNITLVGTTTVTLKTGYSANTWYAIRLTFNVIANTATAAISEGTYQTGGTWGSESSAVTMNESGDIDRIGIGGDVGTGQDFMDYISGTDPLTAVGPANLKTYNTNALANIKSINTNLIANVKTLNTNA